MGLGVWAAKVCFFLLMAGYEWLLTSELDICPSPLPWLFGQGYQGYIESCKLHSCYGWTFSTLATRTTAHV